MAEVRYCPLCGEEMTNQGYNYDDGHIYFYCEECDVELKENDCLENQEDFCDEISMWDNAYDDETLDMNGVEVVCWPESQSLMDKPKFRENSWLINDEEGLDMFGSSAYVVNKNWLNNHK